MSMQSLMGVVTDLVSELESGTLSTGFMRPLERGSAHGSVAIVADDDEPDQRLLVVRLSMMPVPSRHRERFMATLLELNHRFRGRAAFSVDDLGMSHLTAGRPVVDLDEGEIVDLILWTTQQADHWDDLLLEAFAE